MNPCVNVQNVVVILCISEVPNVPRGTLGGKKGTMTTRDDGMPIAGMPGANLYKQACTCGKSMVLVTLPFVHCPSCHHTWRAKQLTAPTRCPRCQFNLYRWRTLMGASKQDSMPGMPI